MTRSIGDRLELVAELLHTYGPFRCVADVGSDHALLALRALGRGDAAFAVASDLRPGPLARGRANAASHGFGEDRIRFCLSDGFDGLGEFAFDCACVCGMGGELIAELLKRYGPHPTCRFLLQPMTAQDDLRRFLWENGYRIDREAFTCERNRPYAVLAVRHTGEAPQPYRYADLFLGKERPRAAAYAAYAEKVRTQAEKRLSGRLARGLDPTDEQNLLAEIAQLHLP